jgi:hypothetical protein
MVALIGSVDRSANVIVPYQIPWRNGGKSNRTLKYSGACHAFLVFSSTCGFMLSTKSTFVPEVDNTKYELPYGDAI